MGWMWAYNIPMSFLLSPNQKPVTLQLRRDLVRNIKRGHAWVYPEALRGLPQAKPGAQAILLDNRGGREIGRGYFDPDGAIALRVCTTQRGAALTDNWAQGRIQRAIDLRQALFDENTTGYRLLNGEGDGLPGLVCDRYGEAAVLKLDGEAARRFWDAVGIAELLAETLGLKIVYERFRGRDKERGRALFGPEPSEPAYFLEHGVSFAADLVRGQKTGFFLDMRENRRRMQVFAAGKTVLNVFGYTGGFSVYAGLGGAKFVTTVDTAQPALDAADVNWRLNDLPPDKHTTVCADAFEFLESAKQEWDVVILDPPSFAPSKDSLPQALKAYQKMVAAGALVTADNGILAVGSCSSHVSMEDFTTICQEGISQARGRATILSIHTQPPDHPAPLAMPEFRYLKFVIMRVNK